METIDILDKLIECDSSPLTLENNQELFFSTKLACPTPGCDFALPELEPRLFSFNSPFGACPNCDGLGFSEFFDIEKIIADEKT